MGQLDGKTAIITGGGTGIGRAVAKLFHDEGAYVVINGRRQKKLDETSALISPGGERIHSVVADMTYDDDIKLLLDETVNLTGRLDIFVNNAGVMRFGQLHETPTAEWELMMKTNAYAPWRTMVYAVPLMRKTGGGSIINISSIAGIKAFPGAGIYCASKAALQTISQVMAMEAALDNIRVNCILPALVEDTELAFPIVGEENIEDLWKKLRPLHPMGRSGKPSDIADAALFFASEQSSFITGTLLNVDGGRHMSTNRPVD